MQRRFGWGLWGVGLLVLGGVHPRAARADLRRFMVAPPVTPLAAAGVCTLRWMDQEPGDIDPGCVSSITWYYASRPDASDRRRLTTALRDDFSSGFLRNWRTAGITGAAWAVRKEGRPFLSGPAGAAPAISAEALGRDQVVSVLVRPRDLQTGFTLGYRVQAGGQDYELKTVGNALRLAQGGEVLTERKIPALREGDWYWYEVGFQTRKNTEVVVRVRLFDEERQHVLTEFCQYDRPRDRALLDGGRLALWGPADYAEVYADPWECRWVDDCTNELKWDTSGVPDGDYYVVAEVADGRNAPRLIVSRFTVQVRNSARAQAN